MNITKDGKTYELRRWPYNGREIEHWIEVGGEDEHEDNLGKTRRWSNYLGGFCEECGGTGRSESGCEPCYVCDNGKI